MEEHMVAAGRHHGGVVIRVCDSVKLLLVPSSVRDVIPTPDLRIGTGSARSETRPDRGRLPLMAVGPLSRSAI
jgi:hypothetical protein